MRRVIALLKGFFGGDRRTVSRDDEVKRKLANDHMLLAKRAAKLNGHSADEILAAEYRKADRTLHQ
jgi:hypothetical protein